MNRTDMWAHLGGEPELLGPVAVEGSDDMLPYAFDVIGFATDTAALASLAIAELWSVRTSRPVPEVAIERRKTAGSFKSEALLTPVGWDLPPVWDPVAGDYRTADGWIRLHTNYASHRRAAMGVLGTEPERDAVSTAVARWSGDDLESAVVEAGGCAAVMRTESEWRVHAAGQATGAEPPVQLGRPQTITGRPAPDLAMPDAAAPLAGIRVLDLTRVIAGPVATGLLAGYGAEVIRVDPPGFEEVPALLPITTAGKRCVALDLNRALDRDQFRTLVAQAHVIVTGLRPGAMSGLGFDPESLREMNPSIITVTHDAYGWSGPWAGRRGFDSLVQMSTGIAAAGMTAAGVDRPLPMPAQALDHGIGHLLAAAACRALTRLATTRATSEVHGSLVGASNCVRARPTPNASTSLAPTWSDGDTCTVPTAWGPVRVPPAATHIAAHDAAWDVEAGPLGRHQPEWPSPHR